MSASIHENIETVRRHYDSLFDLLDRAKSYNEQTVKQPPPIVNMGFWLRGAKTARQAQEQFVRELASRIPCLENLHILDVGCGLAGPAALLACDYGAHVDGVNIVERQVQWARGYIEANGLAGRVRVHLASAMDLPFADDSFDVVFCLEAAHCFVDKPRFLKETHRVLKAGGKLVFADIVGANHWPLVNWQPALKLNLVTASDWQYMLTDARFEVTERTRIGNAVYPGCRWWAAQTAAGRRKTIFDKSCSVDASPVSRSLLKMRAAVLEFLYFRSVLLLLSRLKLRDFALLTAGKKG